MPHNIKAARLFGTQDTRVVDVPTPQPKAREVCVRVRATAICASNVQMYKHGSTSGGIYLDGPITQGHEFSREIATVGENADVPPIDTRVAVEPNWHCGECDLCREGLFNLCRNTIFPSFPPRASSCTDRGGH